MSFLFGKKKETKATGAPPAPRDGNSAGGANSSVPAANGPKGRERGPSTTQSPTPGSSVDTSVSSAGGAHTPSPEHGPEQRGGPGQEVQVCPALGILLSTTASVYIFSRFNLHPSICSRSV